MRQHIRQAISLTGINSELFGRNIPQIEKIHVMFRGALAIGTLKEWMPTYQGSNLTLDMHNRYFTKSSFVSHKTPVLFDGNVDPDGYLAEMQRDLKFIHTDDNVVEYFGVGVDER